MPESKKISQNFSSSRVCVWTALEHSARQVSTLPLHLLPASTESQHQQKMRVWGLLRSFQSMNTTLSVCRAFYISSNMSELFKALVYISLPSCSSQAFWCVYHLPQLLIYHLRQLTCLSPQAVAVRSKILAYKCLQQMPSGNQFVCLFFHSGPLPG